ncbi:MAG TPA: UDP-N-acetylglucosamine 2-epimerase (non-hydrolyzing) [Chitinophaga sp.]
MKHSKCKILLVFGTRPEAIKMAPLIKEFKKYPEHFEIRVCVTAQHRQMLDQVLEFFEITPEYDLNLMRPDQNLYQITSDVILNMKTVYDDWKPDYTFLHGDTTTSSATALASFYAGVRVGHVEAGLRTYNKLSPFPEEINRQITSRLADLHFAPTENAQQNLLREQIPADKILVTGNTVIDALLGSVKKVNSPTYHHPEIEMLKSQLDLEKDTILVTGHRRENFGDGFIKICQSLKAIAEQNENVQIIYPVHLNPNVQKPVYNILGNQSNIKLLEPLSYPAFIWLMDKAKLIITDSGGVQEEAPSLGKPVLLMRDTTERPEAVTAGTVILVGTDEEKIIQTTTDLLTNADRYDQMSRLHNPYGDGTACQTIINYLMNEMV